MAVKVKFFENQKPEHYVEGPFVLCECHGWRIEVENPQGKCSQIPSGDLWDLVEHETGPYRKGWEEKMVPKVDHLNDMVRRGQIVLEDEQWVPGAEFYIEAYGLAK